MPEDNFKLEFDFGQPQAEDAEALDFSGKTPVGSCPKCHGQVYEAGLSYLCENSVTKPKTCDFRSGRIILQQEIAPEQMAKLLKEGQTDLLPGFVSQRTHRPFKAYLALGKDGKVSFKFEETSAKASAAVKKRRRLLPEQKPQVTIKQQRPGKQLPGRQPSGRRR